MLVGVMVTPAVHPQEERQRGLHRKARLLLYRRSAEVVLAHVGDRLVNVGPARELWDEVDGASRRQPDDDEPALAVLHTPQLCCKDP